MSKALRQTDWRHMMGRTHRPPVTTVDTQLRLRVVLVGFSLLAVVVFARVAMLELSDGEAYRVAARKPLVQRRSLPGVRGRILAADGTVLARDVPDITLAVHYRYLQQPADQRWLRSMARARLPRDQRRDPAKMRAAEGQVLADRARLHRRLRQLCRLSVAQWNERTAEIQRQVERIAGGVNARRKAKPRPVTSAGGGWWRQVRHAVAESLKPENDSAGQPWITVAEELDYHTVAGRLPISVVAEIQSNSRLYRGVRIGQSVRRHYPRDDLAAHVIGHLGAVTRQEIQPPQDGEGTPAYHPHDRAGRMGVERQYESLLRGRRGEAVELVNRVGRLLESYQETKPGVGRDLVLTLDVALQHAAESLLKDALARRRTQSFGTSNAPAGGAIVVMDVHSGAILAAASAPRFDPNLFTAAQDDRLAELLSDTGRPLFDRVAKMQIPPGSVFKTLSAIALLETGTVAAGRTRAEEPLFCRGYLHHPDRRRCLIFKRTGRGHGRMTLPLALSRSCNVYFFQYAQELGAGPLVYWARKAGFGRTTGIDLPDEAAGSLPQAEATVDLTRGGDALALSIGQGTLTATPLQVVRLMAAVANGGTLVTPHVVSHLGLAESWDSSSGAEDDLPPRPPCRAIVGLHPETLNAIRRGLELVVSDTAGTAHATVFLDNIAVAGKTGTAETGGGREDHAWFAGYAPAGAPQVAFVVVLEHSGSGASVAGPVARRLVQKTLSLGYLPKVDAESEQPRIP